MILHCTQIKSIFDDNQTLLQAFNKTFIIF
jgi:hypothetical protein